MQVVTPPHNLEELLAVMAVRDEINMGTMDQAIMASPWVEKFRAYLRRMKLEDDENILKFLILVQVLYCDSEVFLLSCLTIFNTFLHLMYSLNLFCHPYPFVTAPQARSQNKQQRAQDPRPLQAGAHGEP